MGFSTLVCSYIYGTFEVIVGAVEAYQHAARAMLEKIETLAQATMNFYTYTIAKAVETCIAAVKMYEKMLVDMIYDPSSNDALGHSIWCSRLWDCLTFVNQLLDPNSLLFKQLDKWFGNKCQRFVNGSLLNSLQSMLSDFQTFQQTVCAYGFTLEFGISIIKKTLMQYKKKLVGFIDYLKKKCEAIKRMHMAYLDWTIDTGIIDYLAKIEGLFNCVIDSSETCAAIATASNYFNDACNKFKIQKSGDTWSMSTPFKNKTYGWMDAKITEINNLDTEIDMLCSTIVNNKEAKRAANAYNLSKNVFPGGITWSDVSNSNGEVSWSKLTSKKTWRKNGIYKYTNLKASEVMDAWRNGTAYQGNDQDITTEKLLDGTEIDKDGNIYYRHGCYLDKIEMPEKTKEYEEYYSDEDGSNEVIYNNGEIMSVTQAAIEIQKNPESDLAKHCEKIWKRLNEWSKNTDVAKRYAK